MLYHTIIKSEIYIQYHKYAYDYEWFFKNIGLPFKNILK